MRPSGGKTSFQELAKVPYFSEGFVPARLFHIDLKNFKRLLKDVDRAANGRDNQEKMRTLEDLTEYLLSCVACFKVEDKARTATGELDLHIKVQMIPCTVLQEWSLYVPVECKNWAEPIGSEVVSKAAQKARDMGSKVSLVFSRMGITGNAGRDGVGQVRNIFLRDTISVIVLSGDDLQRVADGENFLKILEEKYHQIRLLA